MTIKLQLTRPIVCAACKYNDIIICGARHFDSVMHSQLNNFKLPFCYSFSTAWEQGFINTWGEFLTREEAWLVACHHDQIRHLVGNQTTKDYNKPGVELFSENLY